MAAFVNGSAVRNGKVSRKRSESASQSSVGSEFNALSDVDEAIHSKLKRKSNRFTGLFEAQHSFMDKTCYSSDDEAPRNAGFKSQTTGRTPKCFSRNAVMARQNRQKKKQYLQDLENEIQSLRNENRTLKTSLEGYSKDFQLIRKENLYLRNVLANSNEISQLIHAVNFTTGLPTSSSLIRDSKSAANQSQVESNASSVTSTSSHSFFSGRNFAPSVKTVRKDFPIAFDDVPLSSSAKEDDEADILFSSIASPTDLDLSNPLCDEMDFGFGPNSLGDWLDGDEALSDVGVCLHVAKKKVSLEFCSSCNEKAFSNLNEGISDW